MCCLLKWFAFGHNFYITYSFQVCQLCSSSGDTAQHSGTAKCMVCPYPTATEFFSVGCGIGNGCYSKSSVLSLLTIDVCIVISVVVLPKLYCHSDVQQSPPTFCFYQQPWIMGVKCVDFRIPNSLPGARLSSMC